MVFIVIRILMEQGVLWKTLVVKNRTTLSKEGDECAVFDAVLGHELRRVALKVVAHFTIGRAVRSRLH